ncbi:MAG: CPBP family intramembrane metalloprotease [Bacteroidales bacterium]|nr:CPBP family intramembrane metalloprotease [Bacteroidales bacterium]
MTARTSTARIVASALVAAALWFVMFSPWTAPHVPFWGAMAVSSALLLVLAFTLFPGWWRSHRLTAGQIGLGIAIAAFMWGVFWLGDKLSALMFSFARPQVDSIYALKTGADKWLLAAQLLLLTGPAEEIFWRGCLQKAIGDRLSAGRDVHRARLWAAIITLAVYTLIHIWSFNFMLIMAALVAGAVWGLLYYLKPEWLPALVVSHAVWDAAVFVVIPIL